MSRSRALHFISRAVLGATVVAISGVATVGATPAKSHSPLPPGAIHHVVVIDLENESFATTFGPNSPATYLNNALVPSGELIDNYFAIGHVSLDNYIAQVSGQAPTPLTSSDCVMPNFTPSYVDVVPGTPAANGQVNGDGCVFPASRPTIGDQLHGDWREYAQDMGNNPVRDHGVTCAHPAIGGPDNTESATTTDQYANRHNPFIYFHSVIDDSAMCNANVVPLGSVAVGTPSRIGPTALPDSFSGPLANDLRNVGSTPAFAFITPNLCNDGHDGTCAGTNTEGGKQGGLIGADLWLKHWIPLLLASPAYRSGQMLIVVTFDEAGIGDTTACCNEQPGPNWAFPGHSPLLGPPPTTPGADPGGGKIGAVLLNARYITPGTHNTTGFYNHYSALRSYEDLLGITSGGDDGHGHLGFAAAPGLATFGSDVFNRNG